MLVTPHTFENVTSTVTYMFDGSRKSTEHLEALKVAAKKSVYKRGIWR